jgi:glutamate 5-kinase
MQHWSRLFDVPCAQMLLTYDDLQRRNRYVNAQNTVSELLEMGVLPVVNENDTVATEELRVGDNDNLAAYVAVLADADLLIICSDVDGLYDADPRVHVDASLVPVVETIDREILAMAGAARSGISTGGMRTKLQAAEKATQRGVNTVLVNGRTTEPLDALSEGTVRGTLFKRSASPLSARKHWMLHTLPSAGRLVVDAGAARALTERGASLLPSGIVDVTGDFSRGDAVDVAGANGAALGKGITQYSAADVRRIRGAQSHEVPDILEEGTSATDYVVHRDDMVLHGS